MDEDDEALVSSGEEDYKVHTRAKVHRRRRSSSGGVGSGSCDGSGVDDVGDSDEEVSEEEEEDDDDDEDEDEEDLTSDEEVDTDASILPSPSSLGAPSLEADLMSGGVPNVPRPGLLNRTLSIAPALAVSNQETAIR